MGTGQLQQAPSPTERQYRAMLQNSSDMTFLLDAAGIIQFASPSCTRILGYAAEHLTGREYLSMVHPDQCATIAAEIAGVAEHPGASDIAECQFRASDNSWRWVEFTCSKVFIEPGIASIVVNSRDITDRRRANNERQVFYEVVQALNSARHFDDSLSQIQQSLAHALHASNFLIALQNPETKSLELRTFVNQRDRAPSKEQLRNSCAGLVFHTGRPMLIRGHAFDKLIAGGEIELTGTRPLAWIGVPLRTPAATAGVLALEDYENENAYSDRDLILLDAIGGQMALAIERKRVEETLRRQQQENEIIFDSAPYIIWYKDTQNHIVRANRSAAQSVGLEVEQVKGRSVYDLFPSEAVRYHQDDLEVIRTGQPKLGIIQPYRPSPGDIRLIRSDKIPYRGADGKITGVVVFSTDITERQRAEDAMRRSEVNYRSLIEGAPYGICRASEQGRLFHVNPAMVEMLAYSSDAELLETNLDENVFREPGERARIVKDCGEVFEGAQVTWNRKDGKQIQVRLSGRPVRDPEWPSTCYELIAENVTEQRALETQLRHAQKMEAVGRLAGGVAHDFNNLLMVIQGHTELLLDHAPGNRTGAERFWGSNEYFSKVEQIQKAAERASALTRQLLAFSRMQVLQAKVIELNATVSEMGKMLPRLIGEDIELELSPTAAAGRVKADASQMGQVILNLAVNARDAMPNGGKLSIKTANVEVGESFARLHPAMTPGPYVALTVSDTGVGMDAETQTHIFEPFFTTKEVGKGTGLGLATVYGIVKQSGGYISVTSEKGLGTTFTLYLPRVEQSAERDDDPLIDDESTGRSETILVVEDEKEVREIAREFLALSGFTVLEARDGAEAD